MQQSTSRAEAERLLGVAEKLLQARDLNGCRDFAVLAQETEPLLDGSDQILAVVDVLIAAEKRINNQPDWYAVLQLDRRFDDLELIKRQYRRLALLLHPDKNKFPFSDAAFKLVADAWNVLSDSSSKAQYDNEFFVFSKVDLVAMKKQRENQPYQQDKLPVRRNGPAPAPAETPSRSASIWTACPYCYNLYEYPKAYEGCCLRCQNCQRAFQAVVIQTLPPTVPGKDAYYCCWGFFPMGFSTEGGKNGAGSLPNWMPPMFPTTTWPAPSAVPNGTDEGFVDVPQANSTPTTAHVNAIPIPTPKPTRAPTVSSTGKKRGRPRKNP